jgi:hypothetical protein
VGHERIFMTQAAIFLTSGPENLLAMAAVGTGVGTYWFYRGFRLLQRKRLILNTPASKIRSASMGLVEISGLAAGPYVIVSPLKQSECYYYRSVAWQWKQEGKSSKWVKVAEEVLHVPFYVDDNTDKVLVDPRGAEMDLHCDLYEQYNGFLPFGGAEMPGSVAEFLTRHAVDPDKKIKVEEYCIKPKNFLFVLGTLSQNPGLDASIMPAWAEHADKRFAASEINAAVPPEGPTPAPQEVIRLSAETSVLPVTAMTQQQKIAAALMKAGISSPAAWAAAGVGVKPQKSAAVVVKTQPVKLRLTIPVPRPADDFVDSEGFDLHPAVVLMQGAHNPAFFISWRSQRDVVNSLSWKSSLMIWGGPALTVACVYFLLAHFGWL